MWRKAEIGMMQPHTKEQELPEATSWEKGMEAICCFKPLHSGTLLQLP